MSLNIDPRPAATERHEQFEVSAEGLGRYVIDVSLPRGYAASSVKYPVIVVVDGNLLFDTVQAQVHGRFNIGGGVSLRRSSSASDTRPTKASRASTPGGTTTSSGLGT